MTFLFQHFPKENIPIIDKASHSDKHQHSKVIKQIKTSRLSLLMDEAFFGNMICFPAFYLCNWL